MLVLVPFLTSTCLEPERPTKLALIWSLSGPYRVGIPNAKN
jgi:hypothetical protein